MCIGRGERRQASACTDQTMFDDALVMETKPMGIPGSDGPTRRPKKKAGRYAQLSKAADAKAPFDIGHLLAADVGAAIAGVLENGDMVSFTMTSDGGALVICVLTDGDRHKEYVRSKDELDDVLGVLALG